MKPALTFIKKIYKKLLTHRCGLSLAIYLSAAILTGMVCVLFMRAFEYVHVHRLDPAHIGNWCWITIPLLFLAAIELIRLAAPCTDGAGIPQTIFAAKHLNDSNYKKLGPLVSFRTMLIKAAALLIGLWAGASTGCEWPTVHIAACLFFGIAFALHKLFKLSFTDVSGVNGYASPEGKTVSIGFRKISNMRSAVIAGGAAGLASAFNTPFLRHRRTLRRLFFEY